MPSSGVEGWGVTWGVDKDEVMFVLPVLHFFAPTVHVVVSPTLRVTVEITYSDEACIGRVDGVQGQWSVIWAVVVQDVQLCVIQFGPNLLVLSTLRMDICLTSMDVVPNQG